MPLTPKQTSDIESAMADFLLRRRPAENLRHQVDLAWRIEGQSVEIFTIRPFWRDQRKKIESSIAKATYVRTVNRWKIFWKRADSKWQTYQPHPEAVFFDEFLSVVDEDENHCFWG